MFEKLPTPFGLLRAGVAPDHFPKMKTVAKSYDKIADNSRYRFFGVNIGADITIAELKQRYDAIIIATGAESDRKMGIDGEQSEGSYTATEFVGWYNCHPNHQSKHFNLNATKAVIIGQGNVAVDVTRILANQKNVINDRYFSNSN